MGSCERNKIWLLNALIKEEAKKMIGYEMERL